MRTREAILPDAETHPRTDLGLLRRRHAAAAHLRRNLRERARLCGARRSRADCRLRRAPSLWPASGGDSLDHRRSRAIRVRAAASGWSKRSAGRSGETSRQLHLPVYAQAGFLRAPGIHRGAARRPARQDSQRLLCLPALHCCDEVAMVRGELPKFAMLPEPANMLVKIEV